MGDTFSAKSLTCPYCEAHELQPFGHNSARCQYGGGILGGPFLQTLQRMIKWADAVGHHACEECGHPEMRRLPDGVYRCPACGSEVLPISHRSS